MRAQKTGGKGQTVKALSEQGDDSLWWIEIGRQRRCGKQYRKSGRRETGQLKGYRNPVKVQAGGRRIIHSSGQPDYRYGSANIFDAGQKTDISDCGITGSGKTESVYATHRRDDRKGRQAIVLISRS